MTTEGKLHDEGNRHGLDRELGRPRIAHLGSFHGDHYNEVSLDTLLSFAIPHSDLEVARSLFSSKWWDYRFVHPGYAFFAFADAYTRAVEDWRSKFGIHPYAKMAISKGVLFRVESTKKTKIARTKVRSAGDDKTPESVMTLAPATFRTGLWRAMCSADAHGVPYDRFNQLAMQIAFDRQYNRMPLPTNLYTVSMVQEIVERWRKEEAELLRLPDDPLFFAAAYCGDPWQRAQQDWLIGKIAARSNPVSALAQYLALERRIVPALAVERFGAPMVRDAIERARRYR